MNWNEPLLTLDSAVSAGWNVSTNASLLIISRNFPIARWQSKLFSSASMPSWSSSDWHWVTVFASPSHVWACRTNYNIVTHPGIRNPNLRLLNHAWLLSVLFLYRETSINCPMKSGIRDEAANRPLVSRVIHESILYGYHHTLLRLGGGDSM